MKTAGGRKSGGSARRPDTRRNKRDRILRAAIVVFARKGFYTARVSDIARSAGVADGTIYLYFKNKDDILVSLFDERLSKLIETLRVELPPLPDATSRLRRLIQLQIGTMEAHRDLAEVVTVNLRQSTRLLKQFAAPRFAEYLEVMSGVIHEGQNKKILRADVSPMTVARMVFGAIDGLALTWALGNAVPGELSKAAEQLANVVVSGLRAEARH